MLYSKTAQRYCKWIFRGIEKDPSIELTSIQLPSTDAKFTNFVQTVFDPTSIQASAPLPLLPQPVVESTENHEHFVIHVNPEFGSKELRSSSSQGGTDWPWLVESCIEWRVLKSESVSKPRNSTFSSYTDGCDCPHVCRCGCSINGSTRLRARFVWFGEPIRIIEACSCEFWMGGVGGSWLNMEKVSLKKFFGDEDSGKASWLLNSKSIDPFGGEPIPPGLSFWRSTSRSSSNLSSSTLESIFNAPSLSRISWVNGWPLDESTSGAPFQPRLLITISYSSCRPLTNCCCCCSSISTYLQGESARVSLSTDSVPHTLLDKPCHVTFSARQTHRLRYLSCNDCTDWTRRTEPVLSAAIASLMRWKNTLDFFSLHRSHALHTLFRELLSLSDTGLMDCAIILPRRQHRHDVLPPGVSPGIRRAVWRRNSWKDLFAWPWGTAELFLICRRVHRAIPRLILAD